MATDQSSPMPGVDPEALKALDALISCWSAWDDHEIYYLETLAPQIVTQGPPPGATRSEVAAIEVLQGRLDDETWHLLPELMKARRGQRELQREVREEEAQRAAAAARQAASLRERALRELSGPLTEMLRTDFPGAEAWLAEQPLARHLPEGWLEGQKVAFVRAWSQEVLGEPLDDEQARAVAADGHVRVTARAGSGKTRTLVARSAFLVRHCGVPAHSVLLVAFNRKAAEEIRDRLAAALPPGSAQPFAMTFHALAHAVVHPLEELLHDSEQSPAQSRVVQGIIHRAMRTADGAQQVRSAMLEYYSAEWGAMEGRGLGGGRDDLIAREYSSALETLGGEFVKSYGERLIANTLFRHDVDYRYERPFRWNAGIYRPDFTVLRDGRPCLVVEYFGLQGRPDYDNLTQAKRAFWAQRDESLVELTPGDIAKGSKHCSESILAQLDAHEVPHRELSDDEVWERARQRGVDRFSTSMTGFVNRARQRDISPDDLDDLARQHIPLDKAEQAFLTLARKVHRSYLHELSRTDKEDFSGLMWRAARDIAAGRTRFQRDRGRQVGDISALRHVLVDEFQDFSAMFDALLRAVVAASSAHVFAVGDDWQSINGFAGSDPAYFAGFAGSFPGARMLTISSNYRSSAPIVDLSNAVMRGRGTPARTSNPDPGAGAGQVAVVDIDHQHDPDPDGSRFHGDPSTPVLLRVLAAEAEAGSKSIAVLVRRRAHPWQIHDADFPAAPTDGDKLATFADYLRTNMAAFGDVTLNVATVHSYKGMEADSVVIADAHERAYPLLHPAWSFTRVFGDDLPALLEEERRLFYVASTRARHRITYLASRRWSPFLAEEVVSGKVTQRRIGSYPQLPPSPAGFVEVQVHHAYEARDRLKGLGFAWNADSRRWYLRMPHERVDLEQLQRASGLPAGNFEVIGPARNESPGQAATK